MSEKIILVVQHDKQKRDALTLLLRMNGFCVSAIDLGSYALHLIEKEIPDLLLVVDHLSDMPGQEVISLAKGQWPELKAMMISSEPDQDEETFLIQAGCDLYMPDYSDKNILLKAIKGLL